MCFISLILFKHYLEYEIKQKITKSTVIVRDYVYGTQGSGLVIVKNKQKYILTNEHVCKKDRSGIDNLAIITDAIEDKIVVYNDDKYSEKIIDICFIKYGGIIQGYNLDRNEKIFKIYDSLPFQQKGNSILHYTRIRNDFDKILINEGKTGQYIYKTIFDTTNSEDSFKNIKIHSNTVYLKIVSGDSGSPLFKRNGEMEGVVFAQKTKDKKKGMKLTRKEEEKLVLLGFYTKINYFNKLYNSL